MNKRIMRILLAAALMVLSLFIGFQLFIAHYIPNNFKILLGEKKDFYYNVPFEAEISGSLQGVLKLNNKNIPKDKVQIELNKPFTLQSNQVGKYDVNIKLLGLLTLKRVEIEVVNPQTYIPIGEMVGVTVKTDGILVVGTGYFINYEGKKVSPSKDKLFSGDYITSVNQIKLTSKEELIEIVKKSKGKNISLTVRRNGEEKKVEVAPKESAKKDEFKLGIWVRDDTQGIGTLTYVNLDKGTFGALGHGISDIDTHELLELSEGTVGSSLITSIKKGMDGEPGEISGVIVDSEENIVAKLKKNSQNGIFGSLTENGRKAYRKKDILPIGFKYEVKIGKAYIRSDVDGKVKDYEIRIEKLYLNDEANKGMVLKVVDKDLLKLTNGIIQGMSGSPIIQDGRLIGAVTHVFIQDSTKGYGAFIENMILDER